MDGWRFDEEQILAQSHSIFHKILINYKEGNGDFMVKTGRHKLVQVIKVNTVNDGMIRHPVPPDVMH